MNKSALPLFLKRNEEMCLRFFIVYSFPQRDSYSPEKRCSVIKAERGFYWIQRQMRNKAVHHKELWTSEPSLNLATLFILCHSTCLHSFFQTPSRPSLSLPLCVFSSACLCWHLHSSVFERKKDERFFSLPVVFVSDSFLSPPCVLCLLSHQWNIEESTEHVSNPHVCCWVCLAGQALLPSAVWGCCVCLCVWVITNLCAFCSHVPCL